MKKLILLLVFFVSLNCFGQNNPLIGTWNFGLINKIDVNELIKRANEIGGNFKDEDIDFVYAITAIYVMGRCENSEITISEYENTVLITTTNYYDPTIVEKKWGKWAKIGNNLYRIVMDSGEEETYFFDKKSKTITLANIEYQNKIITKLLANNLTLIKK